MRNFGLLGSSALRSGAIAAMAFAATPAFAQDAVAADDAAAATAAAAQGDAAAADSEQAITVTGSRIRRPNLESTVPITSIGGEQFFQQGETNLGETLNELPQLRSTFAQQNPGLGIGIAGLNLLDLRGLGTAAHPGAGQRPPPRRRRHSRTTRVAVDINTIPNDLIERVDIVTGGNSAIYGSDAIAGVVNFVLRRDFDGIQVRGQAGIAEEGYRRQPICLGDVRHGISPTAAATSPCTANISARTASSPPTSRIIGTSDGLFVVDADSGRPDQQQRRLPGPRLPPRHPSARRSAPTAWFRSRSATSGDAASAVRHRHRANNGGPDSAARPSTATIIFTPDGRLVQQTGARFGTGQQSARFIGGNGATGREGNQRSASCRSSSATTSTCSPATSSARRSSCSSRPSLPASNALGRNAGPSFIQGQTHAVRRSASGRGWTIRSSTRPTGRRSPT